MTHARTIQCPKCSGAHCKHCRKCLKCFEDEICPKGPNGLHEAPDTLLRDSGPYKAESLASGKIVIQPSWGQFADSDPEEGGGPDVFSRLDLAEKIETLLNVEMKR